MGPGEKRLTKVYTHNMDLCQKLHNTLPQIFKNFPKSNNIYLKLTHNKTYEIPWNMWSENFKSKSQPNFPLDMS